MKKEATETEERTISKKQRKNDRYVGARLSSAHLRIVGFFKNKVQSTLEKGSTVLEFKEAIIVCLTLETEETYFNPRNRNSIKGSVNRDEKQVEHRQII